MDWRNRKYYCVAFDFSSSAMRIRILKLLDGVRVHPYKDVHKQVDELEARGLYQYLISAPLDCCEAVEYELRKAERRDDWCRWKEVKQAVI